MDKQKHKLYMAQILSLIFKDKDLCNVLGFKGGTALMFFHNLPRFSTDLDLNLLDADKLDVVYAKVRKILLRFGIIDDEAKKQFGPILVLNYGKGERMLKVEISTRQFDNHYEMRTLAGTGRNNLNEGFQTWIVHNPEAWHSTYEMHNLQTCPARAEACSTLFL